MLSLVNDAKHRHCDHGGGWPQRKLKPAAPSEPVWLSFGIIICFISYDCTVLCIDMFKIASLNVQNKWCDVFLNVALFQHFPQTYSKREQRSWHQ